MTFTLPLPEPSITSQNWAVFEAAVSSMLMRRIFEIKHRLRAEAPCTGVRPDWRRNFGQTLSDLELVAFKKFRTQHTDPRLQCFFQ